MHHDSERELVLILHDILASRRDYVASSALRSYFYPPGVGSKSATTTFDNKSYSRTVQKSEDITVDTTASGKHSIRFSFGRVRKTDDSSTSRPSFKWKISNWTSYYGKQLPGRTQPASFLNSIGDGEKRFKAGKPTEFSQRWLMTSHQASMQNPWLPIGFVYVPVVSLSKEEPVIHDSESHEPEKPGG
ncbi:uncharacterized protein LOC109833708 isoform X2 [Asparagus officinalis]|uniref:uncharacterized protein LOC109833708 isoform X2 n=1 Tax=Asparagus officinalis TaxID=4686 RepID=UPI00098E0AB5|nr:uncharacterized protein LOC109833708 isoform X2 [Asparagus officinalis]